MWEGTGSLFRGHWIPRKFDAVIVHPRPTAETAVYEQHKNAYPGIAWSTRVLVFGGAYPFRFELVTAPAGMTIGATLIASGDVLVEPANYGKLEWANPTTGDHTITVRVYDQDYGRGVSPSSYVEVTWTLTVGTTNWVFIDPVTGNNANAGTLAAPFADTTPFITGSTYANKCVMLRAGTMTLVGMGGGNYTANASAPKVFVGYPGETAQIYFTSGYFNPSVAGFCLYNLSLEHSTTMWATNQWVVAQYQGERTLISENEFLHYEMGTSGTNNAAVVFNDFQTTHRQYQGYAYNTFTGQTGSGFHLGGVKNCVVHGNRWYDITAWVATTACGGVIFCKYVADGVSIRQNNVWENVGDAIIGNKGIIGIKGSNATIPSAPYGCARVEIAYNTLYTVTTNTRQGAITEYDSNVNDGPLDSYYAYRNSIGTRHNCEVNAAIAITNSKREYNVLTGGNAFETNRPEIINDGNLESGTYLNVSTMKLTGASRASYLGTHGAEIV